MTHDEEIKALVTNPQELLKRKPFTRGADLDLSSTFQDYVYLNTDIEASLPKYQRKVIPQERYLQELDPQCHAVLFDDNIPALCVKVKKDNYVEIDYEKMAVSFQKNIRDKKYLHLTGNAMQFTLVDRNPDEKTKQNFIFFKQYWDLRNMDGMRNKMIETQLSCGDAGLLFYFNYKGEIKCRLISFTDGYVICTHKDHNGDTILETIYYSSDGVEYIDSYDDKYLYRYTNDGAEELGDGTIVGGWRWHEPERHGFDEIPLITHRGSVAWEDAQSVITNYEILYNIFNAIQKRLGWGMLYIKGKFKQNAKKIAGSVIINDESLDGNGEAKYLTPPSPDNIIKTLELMEETIQKCAGTTFILPKDIKVSGDVSGIAVEMTQGLDLETAQRGAIEWQNVCDKMVRLFKQGLAKELVNKKINEEAVTDYTKMLINPSIKIWRPKSDTEYDNMLAASVKAGILSQETGVESHTESKPDEISRIKKEVEEKFDIELNQTRRRTELNQELEKNNPNTPDVQSQNNQ